MIKGKSTFNYTAEELTFPSFHVWHRYQAASQQLLDSWQDNRMTGFKLDWRIDNKYPPLVFATNELGTIVQTPLFGKSITDKSYYENDQNYHAVLSLPEDLAEDVGNGRLVIEVAVDTRVEDLSLIHI